jgi:sugar transferase (PEP-CTERM/EpsH1 system associated)
MTPSPLIAHVVYRFGMGGMENGLVNLLNRLPPERFRHTVVSLTDHTDFRGRLRRNDIAFHDLHKRPGHDLGLYGRLFRLLRQIRPDVVHTRNLNALEAQFVARLAGVRRGVHGEHGRDVFDLDGTNRKYNLLRRAARPLIAHYIAVSRDLADWLHARIGVPRGRIAQIYSGVDSDRFRPRENARPQALPEDFLGAAECVIGSVGRMAAVKDYPTLVRAFIRLLDAVPDGRRRLRLVIVGDGESRAECERLLAEARVSALAWLPGPRDDVPELMRALDVFVLPSLGEGISNTILEAMSTGLPVAASRVGGNPELVRERETGSLFPAGDAEALAQALLPYVTDPGLRRTQGTAARRRIEAEFSMDAMVRAYDDLYARVLNGQQ